MQEIINRAEEFALSEIKKYGLPSIMNFETSNKKAEGIAKQLGADLDVVKIGARLMDIKLGEAFSKGKLGMHVSMSSEATKKFLNQFEVSQDVIGNIINCVEGHHGTKKWICKEAEICANADCYRFLLVKNWLAFVHSLSEIPFNEALDLAEEKAEEKWKVLSIDACKKELEPHYKLIKEIIKKARLS